MKRKAATMMLALILSSLTACVSMRPTMTRFSLDYNRVVADTRNRMILLNIVRAAYREPTYYTALSQIEGSLNLQGSVNGAVANLAGGDATSFSPTVAGSITNAPTFTVVPLTSEEFSNGMLRPVDPETILLLLSQGWQSDLLAPLVVQKVQCLVGDRVIFEIDNRPGNYDKIFDFATMTRVKLIETPPDAEAPFNFSLYQENAATLLATGALDKFDITQKADKDRARTNLSMAPKISSTLTAEIPPKLQDICRRELGAQNAASNSPSSSDAKAMAPAANKNDLKFAIRSVDPRAPSTGPKSADGSSTKLIFRSPDEIVYYLGELLREDQKRGTTLATATNDKILFHVARNAPGSASIVVDHRGSKWSVGLSDPLSREPGSDSDRTLQVIALLNELIASQTSASDFSRAPSTIRVR